MNFFLKVSSRPDYPLKYSKSNPPVDNALDLGHFVLPGEITEPLNYVDAGNSNIPFVQLSTYDVLTTVSGGYLISSRFKELLDTHFYGQVQLFPAMLEYKGSVSAEYYVMNVYNRVPCYDMDNSLFSIDPVTSERNFSAITLLDGPLMEYEISYDIARSDQDHRLVVSGAFRKCIKTAGINSLKFVSGKKMLV